MARAAEHLHVIHVVVSSGLVLFVLMPFGGLFAVFISAGRLFTRARTSLQIPDVSCFLWYAYCRFSFLARGPFVHLFQSYPFCWRSDTPLIYKAVPSWFVAVESIREKLLKNNAETYWVPAFVNEKRFQNWWVKIGWRNCAISRSSKHYANKNLPPVVILCHSLVVSDRFGHAERFARKGATKQEVCLSLLESCALDLF